ncbi:hypothetical protein Droror1_Dr00026633 [Drosera rotundifolia]
MIIIISINVLIFLSIFLPIFLALFLPIFIVLYLILLNVLILQDIFFHFVHFGHAIVIRRFKSLLEENGEVRSQLNGRTEHQDGTTAINSDDGGAGQRRRRLKAGTAEALCVWWRKGGPGKVDG